ncbi:MAG: DUF1573 domain-containing protein [Bacteroidetes bacterium]|nr:DUF1573 domain-containing protein [Bacteroidota bacterium]MBU2506699.1 DUF1573 domain-containing protein [Bacteroidota bacterium]
MKIKLIIGIVFLFTVLILAQNKAPKIFVEKEIYDFGQMNEGEILSKDITIFNKGNAVLEISRVKASCGCTAVKPEKDKLNPGESTKIKVEFNSFGREGIQKKYVYVFSNDPENSQLRFAFIVNVLPKSTMQSVKKTAPVMSLSKTQHNFGTVKEGEVLELHIAVRNNGDADLNIKDVKTSCGCTATMLSANTIKPNEAANLEIKLDTSGRVGQMTRTVSIDSDDPSSSLQTVTLFVNIEK